MQDVLRLLANAESLAVLSALAAGPGYPRSLAARIRRPEAEVARQLRAMERENLVEGRWSRVNGRNVKLYRLRIRRFELFLEEDGYRLVPSAAGPLTFVPPTMDRLPARQPLFGREGELASLGDQGVRFVMIVGLPGIGKTSLAAEFAHRHTGPVLWHACAPFDTAASLLEAVARWLDAPDSALVRAFERPGLDLGLALKRITERLAANAALLVLDDYEKVRDDGIHEVVRRWQKDFQSSKILVLSRVRPPFDLDPATLLLPLGGLTPEASFALLRSHGREPSDELWRVVRISGGHPMTLVLYGRGGAGREPAHTLGELGQEVAESLDETSRTVLLALAAIRGPVGLDTLRLLAGVPDPALPLILLERRALVRPVVHAYDVHDVVRESLKPLIDARPDLHRRAVALYLHSERPEDILEALHHAVHGRAFDVVENLLEADLLDERHRIAERAPMRAYLEVLDEIPLDKLRKRYQALVRYARGRILAALAAGDTAIRELRAARALAESTGEKRILGFVLHELGSVLHATGRREDAERTFRRLLRLTDSEGWHDRRGKALWALHRVYHQRAIAGPARESYKRALQEARRARDRRLVREIRTFCSMSWPNDWLRVMPSLRQRTTVFRAEGEPRQVARVQAYLGEIACRSARWHDSPGAHAKEALRYLENAVTAFEALGDRREEGNARTWRAFALQLLGDPVGAEAEARAVLAIVRDIGPDHSAIQAHQVLARVARARSDLATARKEADAAVRTARRFQCRCVGVTLLDRALVEEARGEAARARHLLIEAVEEAVARGYPDEARAARREAKHRGLLAKATGTS